MQLEMNRFSFAYNNFDLTISTKNTKVMFQPAPGYPYQEPNITVNKTPSHDKFTYPGSTLSWSANIDAKVTNRVAKASTTFGRLKKSEWECRDVSRDTKIKVKRAGSRESRTPKCHHHLVQGSNTMGRTCPSDAGFKDLKVFDVRQAEPRQKDSRRPVQVLQRLPQSLPKRLQH